MASELQNQPFKNREHIKAEINRCAWASTVFTYLSFLFAVLGIIGDALNTTLARALALDRNSMFALLFLERHPNGFIVNYLPV